MRLVGLNFDFLFWVDFAKSKTLCQILVLIASIMLGCSRSEQMGGQVTGGGSVTKSTTEQVNAALDQALQLAEESDVKQSVLVEFWLSSGSKSKTPAINQPLHVFPNFKLSTSSTQARFENKFVKALKENTITRLPKGDCPHPSYEESADASVSQLSYQAKLCFSIGNLQRIPPASLLREILSLVVHEVDHMGGADEPEAKAWQQEFAKYFADRFGDITADIKIPTFEKITEAHLYVSQAQEHYNQNPTDPRIAGDFGTMAGILEGLPFFRDALAIKLKMNPPRPELIGDYTEAVVELLDSVKANFQTYNPPQMRAFSAGLDQVGNLTDKAALAQKNLSAISEYSKDIDRIYDSFLAFSELNYHSMSADWRSKSKPSQSSKLFSLDAE